MTNDVLDQSARKDVSIKLVSVNFVPTTIDQSGVRRTMIGQMSFDVNELPPDVQIQLRHIIIEAYKKQFL